MLRRTAKNFYVENEKLYYCDLNRDGTTLNRLVLWKNEIKRVFLECHPTAGGHRGRDAILFRKFENVITGPVTTSRLKRRLGLM